MAQAFKAPNTADDNSDIDRETEGGSSAVAILNPVTDGNVGRIIDKDRNLTRVGRRYISAEAPLSDLLSPTFYLLISLI